MIEELKRRKGENLCKTYAPNGKADQFIRLVGSDTCFVNLFCAANGVGKSATGANIIANICFGVQNEWFNYPLFKNFKYLKRGRIISDPTTIKEKIVPELKKWFPSNRYEVKYETSKEGKAYEAKWITDTGFTFDIMSNEQDTKEYESVDLGWCWFDEPSSSAIYHATVARMRRGGIIFWTMTPLFYSAWVKDEIYDKRDGVNIDYVTADVEENCKQHGTRGILEHGNIERMIGQYPDEEREARAHGRFGHLLGLVHKKFNAKIHVIEPFDVRRDDFTVFMAHDTHPRVADAVSWMAIDRKGNNYIIDEIFFEGTDVQIAAEIKHHEQNWRVMGRLLDPSGWVDDKRTSIDSYAHRLEAQGLFYDPGSKLLHEGIRLTNEALDYEEKGGLLVKPPVLYVFSHCKNHIREFQTYVWDEYRGRGADGRDPKPRPKDKDDHFMENVHRLLLAKFRFIEAPTEYEMREAREGKMEKIDRFSAF